MLNLQCSFKGYVPSKRKNMNFSYWEHDAFLRNIDYLVVGSGLVGLNTALKIKEQAPEKHVVVIERGALPNGASSKNAGFACFGSVSELLDDLKTMPEAEVFALVKKRWDGLKALRNMLGDEQIGFDPCGGQELFSSDQRALYETCRDAIPYLNNGLKSLIGGEPYTDNSAGDRFGRATFPYAIFNHMEGSIDTGKMIQALLKKVAEADIQIINGLKLESFEENEQSVLVTTDYGRLETRYLALCTNGFAKHHLPAAKIEPARNQVVVTSPIPNMPIKGTFHVQEGYVYFRNVEDRLLIGGFRHLFRDQERTDAMELTDNVQRTIYDFISSKLLPDTPFTIDYSWSGIMGIGASKSYICQKISSRVFCGIRLGGMGVALGSLVGQELGVLIGREVQM